MTKTALTVNNPIWVDVYAFRSEFNEKSGGWLAAPRHYQREIADFLARGIRLFDRIPSEKLRKEHVPPYVELYAGFHYQVDGGVGRMYVTVELLRAMHPEQAMHSLYGLLDFFIDIRYCLCFDSALEVSTGPLDAKRPRNGEPVFVTSVVTLPVLLAKWLTPVTAYIESERLAYLDVVHAHYPNVPSEVALRWHECEQGRPLASRIANWSKTHFARKRVTVHDAMKWHLNGYVPAEYETAVSLRGLSPEQNTWLRAPLVLGGRLLHGINEFRFLRNMPTRLKVASDHEYFEVFETESELA